MEEFAERYFGDAEGMNYEERIAAYHDKEYPNQEDISHVKKRVMEGLSTINQTYQSGKVLLIAHGAVINAILSNVSNGKIGVEKTRLYNACISSIQYQQEQWIIKSYNEVSHLSEHRVKG